MSSNQPIKTQTFHDFEHAGWQLVASTYERYFGSLTSQTIVPLLDAVRAGASSRLLDIACGPGYVCAAAAQRGADVIGVDFSSIMVEMAGKMNPGIQFEEGDAEKLNFDDLTFDCVTMNFGILHLEKPEEALRQAYRVLKPDGRFAFTVWGKPAESVGFDIILSAISNQGNAAVALPQGPPFFRFSEPEESRNQLMAAGFKTTTISKIPLEWHFQKPEQFFEAFHQGTPRTGGTLRAQTPAQLSAIRAAVEESLKQYQGADSIAVPMVALVVSASK
jgi:ubiquinone/menaquinone biosynthesis C-methylase UbiE